MKTKFLLAVSFALISSAVIFSCKKKSTASTNADYAGTWSTTSKCSSSMTYQMTVTAGSGSTTAVTLTNFHATASTNGYTLTGTISDKSISIPSQTVKNSQGANQLTFSGSGTLTPPSALSISYTATDPTSGASLSCTATCSK